jgi:hypothetical protein
LLSAVFAGFGEPRRMMAAGMAAVIIRVSPAAKITIVIEISVRKV